MQNFGSENNMKTFKPMGKKGFDINALLPIALVFVVTGIAIAYGLNILTDVKSTFTTNSIEYNATQNAVLAVSKFPAKMGILATVMIAAILIGVLVRYMGGMSR